MRFFKTIVYRKPYFKKNKIYDIIMNIHGATAPL